MNNSKRLLALAISAALAAPMAAHATNGMNMEGYGPIATGMGGASMAYDNGTAAMMNNPATLGMMAEGSQFELAIGIMGPSVEATNSLGSESSSATSFTMPAMGYAKKSGNMTYGVGMFAQGGMGAEYDAGSEVDQSANGFSFDGTGGFAAPADTTGRTQRSELGVGRVVFPLSYQVNDKLSVGGSIDYVWGGLDIMWSMDSTNFFGGLDADMYDLSGFGVDQENRRSVISGTLVDNFVGAFGVPGGFGAFHWGHFDFSDDSDFTQATKGTGYAGKLGFTYKPNDKLSIGGSYHPKTAMSDFEGDITMSFNVELLDGTTGMPAGNATIDVTGQVKVVDFQWPTTVGLGMAYQASDRLMIAADVKQLKWSEVMDEFHMVINTDATQADPMAAGFASTNMDFRYIQDWSDQTVINLGAAYQLNDKLTLRGGYNHSSDPTNEKYLSFLFPATIETHYTLGLGYKVNDASAINFSLTHAPEVKVQETNPEVLNAAWGGVEEYPLNTVTHSQTSYQLMYSYKF